MTFVTLHLVSVVAYSLYHLFSSFAYKLILKKNTFYCYSETCFTCKHSVEMISQKIISRKISWNDKEIREILLPKLIHWFKCQMLRELTIRLFAL